MICAVAALVCSCDKYGDTIEDLAKRADGISATSAMLLSKVEALQVLADAKDAQTTISSITNEAEGLKVCFSDGSQYVITDGAAGADGADGKPGAAGPDGQDKIKVTETDTDYTFDFGNGNVITVAKTFAISFEEESVEVPAVSTVVLKYTVSGDDETVHVTAKALDGCKILAIDEEAQEITVRASGKVGEHFVNVRAIRNSDAKVCEKIVTVVSGPRGAITLEGALSGYYGDSQVDGVDNYYTQFYCGEVDEDNYFVGDAYSLILDFWVPISDVMAFPEGTFVPTDTYEPYTFTIGVDATLREQLEEVLWIYEMFYGITSVEELAEMLGYSVEDLDVESYSAGSELYHQTEDGEYEDYGITGGTVTVELTGATTYKVHMNLVAGDQDWEFNYEGEVPVEDHRPVPTNDWFDDCLVSNWGDYYENGTSDWTLTATNTTDSSAGTVYLEILGPADATELPTGTFTVSDSFGEYTVLAGEDYSYLYKYSMVWDACDEGTLTIEKNSDGTYHMLGSFRDAYYEEDWDFEFKGMISVDISGEFEAPAKNIRNNDRELLLNDKMSSKLMRNYVDQKVNAAKAKKEGKAPKTAFFLHK